MVLFITKIQYIYHLLIYQRKIQIILFYAKFWLQSISLSYEYFYNTAIIDIQNCLMKLYTNNFYFIFSSKTYGIFICTTVNLQICTYSHLLFYFYFFCTTIIKDFFMLKKPEGIWRGSGDNLVYNFPKRCLKG